MEKNYQSTMRACFAGYIVQAIVNNFVPLLFVTFQASYNISLSKITLINGLAFIRVPIAPLISDGESGLSLKELFRNKVFWFLLILMVCAGASEQAVSQWASVFAEKGLQISKSVGDLAGPMAFAIMMGSSRVLYGKYGHKMPLDLFMKISTLLCICCYFVIAFVPSPFISLSACAICGFSVGIMWPGTFSKASAAIKNGGTAMFAIMALAGDLGCSAGPALVGKVAGVVNDNLKPGILCACIFPVVFLMVLFGMRTLKNIKMCKK